jgi:hypothetical protein
VYIIKDIIIQDNEGTLIDGAISGDENVIKEGAEKTSLTLKIGVIGCPETSVRNFYDMLRNNPAERKSHQLRGGNLKSRKM